MQTMSPEPHEMQTMSPEPQMQFSERQLKRFGYSPSESLTIRRRWRRNKRSDEIMLVPEGIDPGL